jgi:hypothetical protein
MKMLRKVNLEKKVMFGMNMIFKLASIQSEENAR